MLSVAAVGIAAAVVVNLAQIVFRYVLFDPLAWTEEVMRYMMIWVTMLGAAASLYRGEEASAGMLGWVPSRAAQTALHVARIALVFTFGAMLAWFGLPFALGARTQVSAAAQIPMVWPNLGLFVGGVAIAVMAVGMLLALPSTEPNDIRPEDVS
jgi:TRAP-type C4-dicarboxylate transport system permease small subunit